jgi:hypothetical protein
MTIDPIAIITVTLTEDTSACAEVADSSQGDPSDPKCPKKCDGKLTATVGFIIPHQPLANRPA